MVEHSLIERKDGTLIAGAYGWWKGDEEYSMLEKYVPEMNLYKTRVWVVGSNDRARLGRRWEHRAIGRSWVRKVWAIPG